jgi:hypothetical protein
MMSISAISIYGFVAWFAAPLAADHTPATTCELCGRPDVQCTAYVPTWVTETRMCKQTEYRNEERTRTCVVHKQVPVTKEAVVKYTEYVEQKIENKREIEVSTPVSRIAEQKYKITVPAKDKVTKTRMVTRCIPVTETRKICENGVEKEITVTCNREVCCEETYECEVDVCAEVEQTRNVEVWDTKKELKTVIDTRTAIVPVTRTKTIPVTFCEDVTEEKTETYTVCVPYEVEKPVEVGCWKLVPRKVTLPCGCGKH